MKKIILIFCAVMLLTGCSAGEPYELCPEYFASIVQKAEAAWPDKDSIVSVYSLADYDEGLENGGHEENGTFILYIYADDKYYSFDLKDQLSGAKEWDWNSIGVFRDEEEGKTYACYADFNRWGEEIRSPQLMLIEFSPDDSKDYQCTSYVVEPIDLFCDPGLCYRIGDNIYIRGMDYASAEEVLGVINLKDGQLSYCQDEHVAVETYAQKIIDEAEWETTRSMSSFAAVLEKDDVIVYGANISEDLYANADILVFTAFRNGEPVAYMSVDLSEDELSNALKINIL